MQCLIFTNENKEWKCRYTPVMSTQFPDALSHLFFKCLFETKVFDLNEIYLYTYFCAIQICDSGKYGNHFHIAQVLQQTNTVSKNYIHPPTFSVDVPCEI
jgi:hypothetical protein